jgi:hypothetical protein
MANQWPKLVSQPFWVHLFVSISFTTFTEIWQRTEDKPTLSPPKQVTKLLLNLGVLVVPLLVFLVFLEVELTVPDRELSVICVVEDVCSLQPRPTEDGTERSTRTKEDSLLSLHSPLPLLLLWSWPEVTESNKSLKFPLLLATNPFLTLKRLLKL